MENEQKHQELESRIMTLDKETAEFFRGLTPEVQKAISDFIESRKNPVDWVQHVKNIAGTYLSPAKANENLPKVYETIREGERHLGINE